MDDRHTVDDSHAIIEVSLPAIKHNLAVIRDHLRDDRKVMAVVKANAYGHGDSVVAQFLSDKIDWFAVNSVKEGVKMREQGIANPILVFGVPGQHVTDLYVRYDLTATVSALSDFNRLAEGTEYHLNVDTGMGRLGILPGEVGEAREQINSRSDIRCTGVYTHFATADEPGSPKVEKQIARFREITGKMDKRLLVHASNSGGVFFYPGASFDMVRIGIGLYGYPPGDTEVEELQPAMRLRSRLVRTKQLKKGDTVSYGAVWQADRDTHIGIIPVGYEDGLSRRLSGKINVGINSEQYPLIGIITMNYCMVDLGEAGFPEGTEVTFLDGETVTARDWAKQLGTITYEVLAGLSVGIPRIYKR